MYVAVDFNKVGAARVADVAVDFKRLGPGAVNCTMVVSPEVTGDTIGTLPQGKIPQFSKECRALSGTRRGISGERTLPGHQDYLR
jgi:hypothetical protein